MFFFSEVTKIVTQRKSKHFVQLSRNVIGLFSKKELAFLIGYYNTKQLPQEIQPLLITLPEFAISKRSKLCILIC